MERPADEVKHEVIEFFRIRYENMLTDRGYPFDVIEAVTAASFDDLVETQNRIEALRRWKDKEGFDSLVTSFKRAMNILKGSAPRGTFDPSLLREKAEKELYQSFLRIGSMVEHSIREGDYEAVVAELMEFKEPIDRFFEGVMVMVEDETVRENRLSLLHKIGHLFLKIADFSRLTQEQK